LAHLSERNSLKDRSLTPELLQFRDDLEHLLKNRNINAAREIASDLTDLCQDHLIFAAQVRAYDEPNVKHRLQFFKDVEVAGHGTLGFPVEANL
jgi:hypothetical protein